MPVEVDISNLPQDFIDWLRGTGSSHNYTLTDIRTGLSDEELASLWVDFKSRVKPGEPVTWEGSQDFQNWMQRSLGDDWARKATLGGDTIERWYEVWKSMPGGERPETGPDPGGVLGGGEGLEETEADVLEFWGEHWEYKQAGGELDYDEWLAAGKPPPPEQKEEEADFTGELAAAVEAYKLQIREMGERERAEAQRLGARDIGKMSRMGRSALLAQGRSAGEIEQLMAGGMEAGARSLNDLIQTLNLQEQRQLAGAEQFGIGTMISGETLEQRQREMMQQAGQFGQSLTEQRRQFDVGTGQWQQQFGLGAEQWQQQFGLGAEQWQQQYGLSQQQLAQQSQQWQQQYGLAQREQQYAQAWWQPLVQVLGGISQGAGAYGASKFF